jgi:hypothetical protein
LNEWVDLRVSLVNQQLAELRENLALRVTKMKEMRKALANGPIPLRGAQTGRCPAPTTKFPASIVERKILPNTFKSGEVYLRNWSQIGYLWDPQGLDPIPSESGFLGRPSRVGHEEPIEISGVTATTGDVVPGPIPLIRNMGLGDDGNARFSSYLPPSTSSYARNNRSHYSQKGECICCYLRPHTTDGQDGNDEDDDVSEFNLDSA